MGNQMGELGGWGPPVRDFRRVVALDRLRVDSDGARLLALVAQAQRVPVLLLLHKSRCSAEVAQARQLAMYLMHVVLQRSYSEVGRFFRRDRTTVAHACAQIEDLREQRGFDELVERIEIALTEATNAREPDRAAG